MMNDLLIISPDGLERKVPIKSWCRNPETGALSQAENLTTLPFIFKQVCLMPDTHLGYGMPIGGVIATKGVVIPNAVGVDIGCGMYAVKTTLNEISTEDLKKVMSLIRERIPVGFNHHKIPKANDLFMPSTTYSITRQEEEKLNYQIGTLGGGNHFIEIQQGTDGHIWFMIHSGSRNFGLKVAKYYNDIAKKLNERWHVSVPKEYDLAFLPIETDEAKAYLAEMKFALEFALENRKIMAAEIQKSFTNVVCCKFEDTINIHHNYAQFENHFGKNVMVHRKGATSAKDGELGIIPGSQGTASYIVRGKGNPDSFMSCSHGAGRTMGRKQAIRTLNLKDEIARLDKAGVIHSIRGGKDLDEAPSAYKDIDVVMAEQSDLVDVVVKLKPLAVIKG